MRSDKTARAMLHYNGHKGPVTMAHVNRNVLSAYPEAQQELTGIQYGKVMSVADKSYQDGKSSNKADMWDYGSETDWMIGIRGTDTWVEMNKDEIIVCKRNTKKNIDEKSIYRKVKYLETELLSTDEILQRAKMKVSSANEISTKTSMKNQSQ